MVTQSNFYKGKIWEKNPSILWRVGARGCLEDGWGRLCRSGTLHTRIILLVQPKWETLASPWCLAYPKITFQCNHAGTLASPWCLLFIKYFHRFCTHCFNSHTHLTQYSRSDTFTFAH